MKYMLLIYTDPNLDISDAEWAQMAPAYMAYSQMLAESGKLVAGDPLEDIASATTIKVRDGKRIVTDGPFAETKEFLGGYYIIDCATLDEALDLTATCPGAIYGSIEIRPLMDLPAAMNAH